MISKLISTVLILILAGCSSVHIEKRRYTKGFSLTLNKHMRTNKSSTSPKDVELIHYKTEDNNILEKRIVKVDSTADGISELSSASLDSNSPHLYTTGLKQTKKSLIKVRHERDLNKSMARKNLLQDSKFAPKNNRHSGLWYFLFLAFAPFIFKFKSTLIRGSNWAKNNATKTRFLLAPIGIASVSAHYLLGNVLQVGFSPSMIAVPAVLGTSAIVLKHTKIGNISKFIRSKISFYLFSMSGLFGAFYAGAMAAPLLVSSGGLTDDPYIISLAGRIALTILLIAVCGGLSILTLMWWCDLSCSGFEGAAIAVLIGGNAITAFILIFGIYMIFRRESDRKPKPI